MTYELDAELAPVMDVLLAKAADAPPSTRGDWRAIRETSSVGLASMAALTPASSGVATASFTTRTLNHEAEIELRWYAKAGAAPGSAVVYAHGGGMIGGSLDLYDELVSWYVSETAVPFLSVGLRLAPEADTTTTLAEDVFSGLSWLYDHAAELGVDPSRIALMGDSGGGGPVAGAAILARDLGVRLAKQILVYPMLDDRNTRPGPIPPGLLTWTYDNNYTGWYTLLAETIGSDAVSPVAAPSRLADFAGLAAAYVEVGDLDIFRDECIAYAGALATSGVPVELHVHPGAPHGFERLAPNADVSRRAMADRARVVASI